MGKAGGRSTSRASKKAPPALSGEDLSRLRGVLESQRGLGGDSYPVAVGRLFELAGLAPSDAALKVLAEKKSASVLALNEKSTRALAFLPEDVERVAGSAAIVEGVFTAARTAATDVFTPAELARKAPAVLKEAFQAAVEGWARAGAAPFPGLLFLRMKGKPYVHRLAAGSPAVPAVVVPPPARPGGSFVRDFERAFERLDRASGKNNYVLVHDLRRALPEVDRSEFDRQVKELRKKKRFTLDSHDGRHVRLTAEQIDAGIRDSNGSNLVYVARRAGA